MIFGHIDDLDKTRGWMPAPLLTALEYLRATDPSTITCEVIEIAPGIRVFDGSLTTKDPSEKLFEIHRANIDIQYVVAGRERMDVAADRGGNPVASDNLETADALHYASVTNGSPLYLESGNYAVFFPEDAHKPGCAVDGPEDVRKIIVKVKTSLLA